MNSRVDSPCLNDTRSGASAILAGNEFQTATVPWKETGLKCVSCSCKVSVHVCFEVSLSGSCQRRCEEGIGVDVNEVGYNLVEHS